MRSRAVRRVEKAGRIGTVGAKKQIGNTHGEKTGAAAVRAIARGAAGGRIGVLKAEKQRGNTARGWGV